MRDVLAVILYHDDFHEKFKKEVMEPSFVAAL